jgi:bifunctional UDP-N-acetylglucosamine pyrophosphorylase/glucosamine-1-phosphate N-acetyltransferase
MIVLAAGEGTRMRSDLPKVLHRVLGRTLLGHVLVAAEALEPQQIVVVVGHGRDAVVDHLAAEFPRVRHAVQHEQRGTGDAVRVGLDALPRSVLDSAEGPVVVLAGDAPLITSATLRTLLAQHADSGAAATVLSSEVPDPTGYGRIVRGESGELLGIVEHKDADTDQRRIHEINSGVYAFAAEPLREVLDGLGTANAAGEEYLTDVLALLRARGLALAAVAAAEPAEVLGVNDRAQLAEVRRLLRDRINTDWMRAGVTIVDPLTTWIGVRATLEPDSVVHQNTQLHGSTHLARFASVGPDCTLRDVRVGEHARVRRTEATGAQIGERADVGPFAYLRPGTVLGAASKVGAYVETKNAVVGEGSKVPHLSYVGDADIGAGSNIGAATIFVNYDGVGKHRTVVGDHARVGSDSMLVAPVTIGDGAYTAAGSVVTQDVPPGALAVGRARQRNIEGWVARKRPGSAAAAAAGDTDSGADQASGDDVAGELAE